MLSGIENSRNPTVSRLKIQVHNAKQNVDSLKVKRKRLTGKINALRCDLEHSQKSLEIAQAKLETERANLRAMRIALEIALRDGHL
jgi:predicted  nucleic acid-binding Zn-ribbon protein